MSIDICSSVEMLVRSHRFYESGTGWIDIDCPSCNDKRHRFGFRLTPTGGFRASCFNAGCEYNTRPTGWEPGNGFGGRPRRLYEQLGGNIKDIPMAKLLQWNKHQYSKTGELIGTEKDIEIVTTFPELAFPKDTSRLIDVYKNNSRANKIMKFAVTKYGATVKDMPLFWSENRSNYLLLGFFHKDKLVGYAGRHKSLNYGPKRFIQECAQDYMYNQEFIFKRMNEQLLVVESPFEAELLGCMGVRNSKLTKKQINLLKISGKNIILVPDHKSKEAVPFINVAQENGWSISIPRWTNSYEKTHRLTDVADAVKQNGILHTTVSIVSAATTNKNKISQALALYTT